MSQLGRPGVRVICWLAVAACCAIVGITSLWLGRNENAIDRSSRLLKESVDGLGLYVDDRSCAECHPSQAASYPKTGHANTFQPAIQLPIAPTLDGKTFKDPHRGYEYHYHFDARRGLSVTIPDQLGNQPLPLAYALGSGKRALTFLTLIPNRAGETTGIEHRLSVYPGENGIRLDLTDGQQQHEPEQDVEHFGRIIRGETLDRCVECHTTGGEIVGDVIRGYRPSVGCQNCHGPRREHVIAMEMAKDDGASPSGSNRLTSVEQIRMCDRCHPRAGMEEENEMPPNHIRSVRLQSTGLLQSKCFGGSQNHLSCSTCHDPHEPISRDTDHYLKRCLDCHTPPASVHCPVSSRAECVRCHMPTVQADDGTRFHDHRIRVRAQ